MCLWLPYERHNLNIRGALWLMVSDRILHPGEKTAASIFKNNNNQSEDDEKLIRDEMMMPLWFSCTSKCSWTVYHIYNTSLISSHLKRSASHYIFSWVWMDKNSVWEATLKLFLPKTQTTLTNTFKVVVSYYWLAVMGITVL